MRGEFALERIREENYHLEWEGPEGGSQKFPQRNFGLFLAVEFNPPMRSVIKSLKEGQFWKLSQKSMNWRIYRIGEEGSKVLLEICRVEFFFWEIIRGDGDRISLGKCAIFLENEEEEEEIERSGGDEKLSKRNTFRIASSSLSVKRVWVTGCDRIRR